MNHPARRAPLSRVLAFAGAAAFSLFLARPGTLSAQNLYVSEYGNNTILEFAPAGAFTVFSYAQVDGPTGMAFDPVGNLYVAGYGGNPNAIEKFTTDGHESTVTTSGLSNPGGIAFDTAGNLYVANYGNSTIAKVAPGGGTSVFSSSPLLNQPFGLAFDAAGNLFVANIGNAGVPGSIVKITPAGVVSVIADSTSVPSGTTGNGRYGGLAFDQAGNLYASDQSNSRILEFTPGGVVSTFATTGLVGPRGLAFDSAGNLYAANTYGTTIEKFTPDGTGSVFASSLSAPQCVAFNNVSLPVRHPSFFNGEVALGQGVYYLAFPGNGNIFGYYEYLSDPRYIYHFDLGYEYVFDLGNGGVVFYDFKSQDYFYTSPTFPFPYLYDFGLQAFLYYYPDPTNPQRYNTNGVRYFYNFSTGQIISK